jgi:hypothetical protein
MQCFMIREFPLNRGLTLRYYNARTADERMDNTIVLARVTAQSHPVDFATLMQAASENEPHK